MDRAPRSAAQQCGAAAQREAAASVRRCVSGGQTESLLEPLMALRSERLDGNIR